MFPETKIQKKINASPLRLKCGRIPLKLRPLCKEKMTAFSGKPTVLLETKKRRMQAFKKNLPTFAETNEPHA